jgi:hypothetical protein
VYGLPEDFDASGFQGRSVELVSFSANTIHIAFDGSYSVTIESTFEHSSGQQGDRPMHSVVPVKESRLMLLVGRSVVTATIERPGTLVLRFDDGQTLWCLDDSQEYESYRISCKDREIIV